MATVEVGMASLITIPVTLGNLCFLSSNHKLMDEVFCFLKWERTLGPEDTLGDPLNLKLWLPMSHLRGVCVCMGVCALKSHLLKSFGNFGSSTKCLTLDTLAMSPRLVYCGLRCMYFPDPLPFMSVPNCKVFSVQDNLLFIEKAFVQ